MQIAHYVSAKYLFVAFFYSKLKTLIEELFKCIFAESRSVLGEGSICIISTASPARVVGWGLYATVHPPHAQATLGPMRECQREGAEERRSGSGGAGGEE